MIDLTQLGRMSSELIQNLTNIVGMIENNVHAYDRIERRNRSKKLLEALENLLILLAAEAPSVNESSVRTLDSVITLLESGPEGGGSISVKQMFDYNYIEVLGALQEWLDLLGEYRRDLIISDHELYEQLEDDINKRVAIVEKLGRLDEKPVTLDEAKKLYEIYTAVVESTKTSKKRLQALIHEENGEKE